MSKYILAAMIVFLTLSGCARQDLSAGPQSETLLVDLGPAPELNNEIWLNTDQPLRLAELRGKVVLLDMWTFG